jgi:hypothetical protein
MALLLLMPLVVQGKLSASAEAIQITSSEYETMLRHTDQHRAHEDVSEEVDEADEADEDVFDEDEDVAVGPPPTPKKPNIIAVGSQLKVSWTIPSSLPTVSQLAVKVKDGDDGEWQYVELRQGKAVLVPLANLMGNASGLVNPRTSIIISGVKSDRQYRASVAMKNSEGWGSWSPLSGTAILSASASMKATENLYQSTAGIDLPQSLKGASLGTPDDEATIVAYDEITSKQLGKQIMHLAFTKWDKNSNGQLSVSEVRHGLMDGRVLNKKHADHVNISCQKTMLSATRSKEFIDLWDRDRSGTLSLSEFMASDDKKLRKALPQMRNRGVVKCLKEVWGKKKQSCGTKKSKVKECAKKAWWKALWCWTKWVVSTIWCFVKVLVEAVVATFTDCLPILIQAVIDAAAKAWKHVMNFLKDCTDVKKCLKKILDKVKELLGMISDALIAGAEKALGKHSEGLNTVLHFLGKIPPFAQKLGAMAIKAATAVVKFAVDSIKQIAKHASNVPDFCLTDGLGFWGLLGTDCGAFKYVGKIFTDGITKIGKNFDKAVSKFGSCIIKLGVLSLPSPFLNVPVTGWCMPDLLQKVLKGLIGTVIYVIAQIRAVATGCKSGADQPICQLAVDFSTIGSELIALFTGGAFPQLTSADEGCVDFQIHAELGGGLLFSFALSSAKAIRGIAFQATATFAMYLCFTLRTGSRQNAPFFDFNFAFEFDLFVIVIGALPGENGYEQDFYALVGFKVLASGKGHVWWFWGCTFKLVAKLKIKGVTGGIGIVFDILPDPAVVWGFNLVIDFKVGLKPFKLSLPKSLLQTDAMSGIAHMRATVREVAELARDAETGVLASIMAVSNGFANTNIPMLFYGHVENMTDLSLHQAFGRGVSAMEIGGGAFAGKEFLKAIVKAGAAIGICFTCLARDAPGVSSKTSQATKAQPAQTLKTTVRRRRTRRRRSRRRRCYRRRQNRRRSSWGGRRRCPWSYPTRRRRRWR